MISMGSCLSQDVVSFYRTRFLVASHDNTVDAYDMARQVHFKFLQLLLSHSRFTALFSATEFQRFMKSDPIPIL